MEDSLPTSFLGMVKIYSYVKLSEIKYVCRVPNTRRSIDMFLTSVVIPH